MHVEELIPVPIPGLLFQMNRTLPNLAGILVVLFLFVCVDFGCWVYCFRCLGGLGLGLVLGV